MCIYQPSIYILKGRTLQLGTLQSNDRVTASSILQDVENVFMSINNVFSFYYWGGIPKPVGKAVNPSSYSKSAEPFMPN